MEMRKYLPSDYSHIAEWLAVREIEPWDEKGFPDIGYIVSSDNEFIAVGFIRLIEGGSGMLDGLCTNPKICGALRNEAIDLLVHRLISHAQSIGLDGLVSYSRDKNTIERSLRFGFKKVPDTLIVKKLRG